MTRVIDSNGELLPDALLDVVRWTERRGMDLKGLSQTLNVDKQVLARAIDAAKANGQYAWARRVLVKKGILPPHVKSLRPRIIYPYEI